MYATSRILVFRISDSYAPIGGVGKIVELDETAIHSKKYGRGAELKKVRWIVGGEFSKVTNPNVL